MLKLTLLLAVCAFFVHSSPISCRSGSNYMGNLLELDTLEAEKVLSDTENPCDDKSVCEIKCKDLHQYKTCSHISYFDFTPYLSINQERTRSDSGYKHVAFVSKIQRSHFKPLYKYTNGQTNILTTNPRSMGTSVIKKPAKNGFVCEGIVGYILSPSSFHHTRHSYRRGASKLYEFTKDGKFFYSVNSVKNGWKNNGFIGYVWRFHFSISHLTNLIYFVQPHTQNIFYNSAIALKGLSNSHQRGYSDQCNKGGRYTNDELSPTLIKLFKSAIEKKLIVQESWYKQHSKRRGEVKDFLYWAQYKVKYPYPVKYCNYRSGWGVKRKVCHADQMKINRFDSLMRTRPNLYKGFLLAYKYIGLLKNLKKFCEKKSSIDKVRHELAKFEQKNSFRNVINAEYKRLNRKETQLFKNLRHQIREEFIKIVMLRQRKGYCHCFKLTRVFTGLYDKIVESCRQKC